MKVIGKINENLYLILGLTVFLIFLIGGVNTTTDIGRFNFLLAVICFFGFVIMHDLKIIKEKRGF